ncbi:MAG: ATP-grasp fold amidoligase family protein [Slackia sp.]
MAFDYKKIIRSRQTRERLLRVLSWVPDRAMVELQYRIKTGRKLDLDDPRRFTEKLQWMKLFYRDRLMNRCADKACVREYVKECGLGELLVPLVGVFERDSSIDFSRFPDRFVLKDSLGGGGNDVLICRDKSSFDIERARSEADGRRWQACEASRREWVYDCPGSSKVLVEEFIESNRGMCSNSSFSASTGFLHISTF